MTMLRDYKTYTYEVGYTYTSFMRDEDGNVVGDGRDEAVAHKPVVVAKSQAVADAWVRERYNASYQSHRDFTMNLIDTQPAPHLILEVPY